MSPIQQMLLGVGAVATKTYVDDVFNTYVYRGSSSAQTFNTGVDLATKGGLIWNKYRTMNSPGVLFDTERGKTKILRASESDAEGTANTAITSFNNNGFSVGGGDGWTNFNSNHTFANWTFRKAKGFFDVVTWTGDGVAGRQISHGLSSIPGCIMIKCTSNGFSWTVGHRSLNSGNDPWDYHLMLHNTDDEADSALQFNDTAPTSTHFTVGTSNTVNGSGKTYVAYVFAGGESPAATARSVVFDGDSNNHDDELHPPSSLIPSGRDSNKFCLETWLKVDATNDDGMIYGQYVSGNAGRMFLQLQNNSSPYNVRLFVGGADAINVSSAIKADTWYHLAWTYDGTTHRMFVNGELKGTVAGSSLASDIVQSTPRIGGVNETGFCFPGQLSKFRVVHDQAVYTASFKPSVTPLTTTSQGVSGSNCKVLCCNNSNILNNDGALAALTNPDNGTITASTDSPFDDPAGFKFGDAGDQNVIKCGRYVGNGNSSPNQIYVGFEPQWVMIKAADSGGSWWMYDTMRDTAWPASSEQFDEGKLLYADSSGVEDSTFTIRVTATGWYAPYANGGNNQNNNEFTYIAIRRPDGYVGKPPELGTDVFAMDTGAGSSTIPNFDSGFPVDFALYRAVSSADDWVTSARLIAKRKIYTNNTDTEVTDNGNTYDSNVGWNQNSNASSGYQSWMWKRHAGFDVVVYTGNGTGGVGRQISHSMNSAPEMIITKARDVSYEWPVWHTGLSAIGNNVRLNGTYSELSANNNIYGGSGNALPTATHWTVGSHSLVNANGNQYISILLSSVEGISKVGIYTGTATTQTITTGFQPRMLFLKNITDDGYYWQMVDTTRGWTSSSNKRIYFNHTRVQDDNYVIGEPLSTGFTITGTNTGWNKNNSKYIYYAHA